MGSSKKQTIGYKYYLGMHIILTHGQADHMTRIRWDQTRIGWEGVVTDGSITINAEGLFGGEKKEGGVSGVVDFCPGSTTQGRNAYLQSQLGTDIPAFRRVVGLVFRGSGSDKSFYWGMNPYLKTLNVRIKRIHYAADGTTQWFDSTAEIGTTTTVTTPASTSWEHQFIPGDPPDTVTEADIAAITIPTSGWGGAAPAPFGRESTGGSLSPVYPINTPWNYDESLWVRKTITCYSGTAVVISGYIENALLLYWDGVYIGGVNTDNTQSATASGIPYSITIPAELVTSGEHTIHMFVMNEQNIPYSPPATRDAQDNTYFFAEIEASAFGVGNGDMNPAHIIRECLTDPDWGMGYNSADISDTAFTLAAATLFDEQMGISLLWDKQIPIEDFVKEILRHINASLYVDRAAGQFVLKLIRADYVEDDLPVLNFDNVEKVEGFNYPAFGELVNSVTVNYWDGETDTQASYTEQDTALIQMQGATINTTLQYPGFTNKTIAQRVALRDLQSLSTPLRSCTITGNTELWDLNIGDPFKLDWPDYSAVPLVFRVIAMTLGDGKTNKVRITATQDQFALPAVASVPDPGDDGGWTDPSQPPVAVTTQVTIEAPYYELVQREGQSAVDDALATEPAAGYILVAAVRPANESNAQVDVDAGSGYEEATTLDFSPLATLDADVDKEDTAWTIVAGKDFDNVDLDTHAQIDDEFVKVTAKTDTTLTVARAVLDSVPAEHAAGAKIVFWDETAEVVQTQYVDGVSLDVKVLPSSGQGTLDIADATAQTVVMASRAVRPYPPGQFKINGSYYPTTVAPAGAFNVTWVHRDRLLQSDQLVGFLDAGVGPEPTTRYGLRFRRADTNALLIEKLDIDAVTAAVILFYTGDVICELFSTTDKGDSLYSHTHTFAYTMPVGTLASSITATTYVPDDNVTIIDGGVVTP